MTGCNTCHDLAIFIIPFGARPCHLVSVPFDVTGDIHIHVHVSNCLRPTCCVPMTDRRSADIGRGPSPDLEQLMHVLVQRAKLLLSLRGVVLAQKVHRLPCRSAGVAEKAPSVSDSVCSHRAVRHGIRYPRQLDKDACFPAVAPDPLMSPL